MSGTWKGAFDFQGSTVPLTINMKIDGTKVTVTVEGLPTTPAEIHEGTLKSTKPGREYLIDKKDLAALLKSKR